MMSYNLLFIHPIILIHKFVQVSRPLFEVIRRPARVRVKESALPPGVWPTGINPRMSSVHTLWLRVPGSLPKVWTGSRWEHPMLLNKVNLGRPMSSSTAKNCTKSGIEQVQTAEKSFTFH